MSTLCKHGDAVCRYLLVNHKQFTCTRADDVWVDGQFVGRCGMDALEIGEDAYTVGLLKTLRNPIAHIRDTFQCEQWLAEALYEEAMRRSDYTDLRYLAARRFVIVPAEEAEEWEGYSYCEYSSGSVAIWLDD